MRNRADVPGSREAGTTDSVGLGTRPASSPPCGLPRRRGHLGPDQPAASGMSGVTAGFLRMVVRERCTRRNSGPRVDRLLALCRLDGRNHEPIPTRRAVLRAAELRGRIAEVAYQIHGAITYTEPLIKTWLVHEVESRAGVAGHRLREGAASAVRDWQDEPVGEVETGQPAYARLGAGTTKACVIWGPHPFEADGLVTEGLKAIRLRNVEDRSQVDHAN